jgi:hypothetical protein
MSIWVAVRRGGTRGRDWGPGAGRLHEGDLVEAELGRRPRPPPCSETHQVAGGIDAHHLREPPHEVLVELDAVVALETARMRSVGKAF